MKLNVEFVLDILRGLDLFEGLDDPALRELGKLFEERIYDQDEVIFEEGAPGNSMMVIASGEVRVSQTSGEKNEETLVVLKKGDIFGEMGLLDDLPRSATIFAHSNVITLEITRPAFLTFVQQDSKSGVRILLRLSRILSARLRETDTKLKTFVDLSQWL